MDRLTVGQRVRGVGFVSAATELNGEIGTVHLVLAPGDMSPLHFDRYGKPCANRHDYDWYVVEWDRLGMINGVGPRGQRGPDVYLRKNLQPVDEDNSQQLANELIRKIKEGVTA